MKWNILAATMVLSLGLSTQSFGFELLDRMLGASDCGCEVKGAAKSNCQTKDCCVPKRLCAPKSCCQSKDGCDGKDGCKSPAQCGGGLFGKSCCQSKDGCGDGKGACEKQCGGKTCCGPSLLERIFACRQMGACKSGKGCDGGKADAGCGCDKGGVKADAPMTVEDEDQEAPMPPAPIVDPSAFLNQHRVIHASTTVVR